MKKETCKQCGKRTKYMYAMNEGVFCNKHWTVAYARQSGALLAEEFEERMEAYRNSWKRHLVVSPRA